MFLYEDSLPSASTDPFSSSLNQACLDGFSFELCTFMAVEEFAEVNL